MENGNWCILRTAAPSTLRLMESLVSAGFDAWTPTVTLSRRLPRSRKRVQYPVPLVSRFVFARADRIDDLVRLAATERKAQPAFSVFRYMGGYPLISDRNLEPLRTAEQREKPKEDRRAFAKGEAVRLAEGAFAGMSGIVELAKGSHVLVCFPGWRIPIKIEAFHLRPDVAKVGTPSRARLARPADERNEAAPKTVAGLVPTEQVQ